MRRYTIGFTVAGMADEVSVSVEDEKELLFILTGMMLVQDIAIITLMKD